MDALIGAIVGGILAIIGGLVGAVVGGIMPSYASWKPILRERSVPERCMAPACDRAMVPQPSLTFRVESNRTIGSSPRSAAMNPS